MSGRSPRKRSPTWKAAGEPSTKAMKPTGQSSDWLASKANHVRIGNLFLAHVGKTDAELSAKWGLSWAELPEAEAAQQDVYSHLATFLVETYTIQDKDRNQGKQLAVGSAHGIWRGLINERREALSKSETPSTQVSFRPAR